MIKMTVDLFNKFSTKQESLDASIREKHDISESDWNINLQVNHDLALKNEIAEFHNECIDQWKYWKKKDVDLKKVISEGVDIIHFLHLNLNKYNIEHITCVNFINKRIEMNAPLIVKVEHYDMTAKKLVVKKDVRNLLKRMYDCKHLEDYLNIYALLLLVLENYNFTLEDIEQAYDEKNRENYERQEQGY